MSSKTFLADRAEDKAIQWLVRLNSPQLTPSEEQAFVAWLDSSPLHQAAYIKAEQLWERGSVLERLSEKPKAKTKAVTFNMNSWQGWALACSCLFAVALGVLIQINTTHNYSYQTALGEQQDIQLDDGSHIVLNTNSNINVQLNRKNRTVYLTQGEVFFEVKKDGRPFDIITQQGTVRVLGTRFSVYQTVADTIVTVIEGKVALGEKAPNGDQFSPTTVLQANERLSFQSAKAGQAPEKLNANAVLSWRKKQLVFKGQSLNQVITELGRYFPETITLETPELGEKEITAVIQLSDFKTTLHTLTQSLNLSAEVDSTGTQVTIRRSDSAK